MSKPNPVIHFEMPYEDRQRMADFYTKAFGWKAQMLGEEMGNYVTVATIQTDERNMVQTPGTINGGFYGKNPEVPDQYPSIVIAVDDVHAAMEEIKAAGGEVVGEPMEIPGVGHFVSFYDTERNRCSVLQPLMPR